MPLSALFAIRFALCAMPSVIASCHGDRPAATVDYIIAVTALAKRLG